MNNIIKRRFGNSNECNFEKSPNEETKSKSNGNIDFASRIMQSSEFINYIQHHGYHFSDRLAKWSSSKMINNDGTDFRWTNQELNNAIRDMELSVPKNVTTGDITYTANMAYADFYPDVLSNKKLCVLYAVNVANDPDGYEGIQFSRWLSDVIAKKVEVPWGEVI